MYINRIVFGQLKHIFYENTCIETQLRYTWIVWTLIHIRWSFVSLLKLLLQTKIWQHLEVIKGRTLTVSPTWAGWGWEEGREEQLQPFTVQKEQSALAAPSSTTANSHTTLTAVTMRASKVPTACKLASKKLLHCTLLFQKKFSCYPCSHYSPVVTSTVIVSGTPVEQSI